MSNKVKYKQKMADKIVITPLSRYLADAIDKQMKTLKITPAKIERMTSNECHYHTVRRIRKGSSGISLRYWEHVLDILGLRLMVLPKAHKDITDSADVYERYIAKTNKPNEA